MTARKRGPWRLQIPAPTQWVSANDRSHWAAKARLVREWRTSTHMWANAERLPHITVPVTITAWVHRTDRRRADAHNRILTVKACIDGLVDAGVLDDDSDQYVTAVAMKAGPVVLAGQYPLGLLTLDISIDGGSNDEQVGRDCGDQEVRPAAVGSDHHDDARRRR